MDHNNFKFKSRTFEKRKAIFNWFLKQNADLCFLQETYGTEEIENQWRAQWRGEIFFAHGSTHSRGVAILFFFFFFFFFFF